MISIHSAMLFGVNIVGYYLSNSVISVAILDSMETPYVIGPWKYGQKHLDLLGIASYSNFLDLSYSLCIADFFV